MGSDATTGSVKDLGLLQQAYIEQLVMDHEKYQSLAVAFPIANTAGNDLWCLVRSADPKLFVRSISDTIGNDYTLRCLDASAMDVWEKLCPKDPHVPSLPFSFLYHVSACAPGPNTVAGVFESSSEVRMGIAETRWPRLVQPECAL